MKDFLIKMLSGDSGVSSKRMIAILYAIFGLGVFVWLEWKLSDMMKVDVFNTVLIFISTMVGVTVFEGLKKGKDENRS